MKNIIASGKRSVGRPQKGRENDTKMQLEEIVSGNETDPTVCPLTVFCIKGDEK
jgi:hypothetical protein